MTNSVEYSSVVPPADQVSANAGSVSGLGSFLSGLAALASPIAQVVQAVQSPKTTLTTATGDGNKSQAPVASTPNSAASGISSKTMLIAGAAVVGVVVLLVVATRK